MKNIRHFALIGALIGAPLAFAILGGGCAMLPDGGLYRTTPGHTNAATGEVTPGELTPNPIIQEAIRSVGTLPLPGAGLAALALGWAYTGFAAIRNRKTALAVIEGIEAGRKILQETPEGKALDDKIRQALIEHQQFRGVLEHVARLVQQYTSETRHA